MIMIYYKYRGIKLINHSVIITFQHTHKISKMDQFYMENLKNKEEFENAEIKLTINDVDTTYLKNIGIMECDIMLKEKIDCVDNVTFWCTLTNMINDLLIEREEQKTTSLRFNLGDGADYRFEIDSGFTGGNLTHCLVYLVYTNTMIPFYGSQYINSTRDDNIGIISWFVREDRYKINGHSPEGPGRYILDKYCIREQTTFKTGFKQVRIAKNNLKEGNNDKFYRQTLIPDLGSESVKIDGLVLSRMDIVPQREEGGLHYPEDIDQIKLARQNNRMVSIWYAIDQYGIPDGKGCTNMSEFVGSKVEFGGIDLFFKTELVFSPFCCHFFSHEIDDYDEHLKAETKTQCVICNEQTTLRKVLPTVRVHPMIKPYDEGVKVCAADLCDQIDCDNHKYENKNTSMTELEKCQEVKEGEHIYETIEERKINIGLVSALYGVCSICLGEEYNQTPTTLSNECEKHRDFVIAKSDVVKEEASIEDVAVFQKTGFKLPKGPPVDGGEEEKNKNINIEIASRMYGICSICLAVQCDKVPALLINLCKEHKDEQKMDDETLEECRLVKDEEKKESIFRFPNEARFWSRVEHQVLNHKDDDDEEKVEVADEKMEAAEPEAAEAPKDEEMEEEEEEEENEAGELNYIIIFIYLFSIFSIFQLF